MSTTDEARAVRRPAAPRPARPSEDDGEDAVGGIGALDRALALLKVLAAGPGPATLTDLAARAGMPPSRAHRYLASFAHAGFVTQTGRGGRYDLGPEALGLGLAAFARLDLVNAVADRLSELVEATGATAMLSIWAERGATVVRWERAAPFVATTLGLGTVFPLLVSATGRAFLAHLPPRLTAGLLAAEAAASGPAARPLADLDLGEAGIARLVAEVRARGYARVEGLLIPGLQALAAPVLDAQDEAACVVTLVGTNPALVDPDGGAARALLRYCRSFPGGRG